MLITLEFISLRSSTRTPGVFPLFPNLIAYSTSSLTTVESDLQLLSAQCLSSLKSLSIYSFQATNILLLYRMKFPFASINIPATLAPYIPSASRTFLCFQVAQNVKLNHLSFAFLMFLFIFLSTVTNPICIPKLSLIFHRPEGLLSY